MRPRRPHAQRHVLPPTEGATDGITVSTVGSRYENVAGAAAGEEDTSKKRTVAARCEPEPGGTTQRSVVSETPLRHQALEVR